MAIYHSTLTFLGAGYFQILSRIVTLTDVKSSS